MDDQSLATLRVVLRCLGSFAVAHFSLSLLICPFGFCGIDTPIFGLLPFFFIALYYPLGLLFGAPIDNARQLVWAVLSQAAIAWCWAGAVIWALHGGNEDALLYVILLTFPLACPSSLLVLVGIFLLESVFASSELLGFILLSIPAGLLPPLLFNLGGFHATRRKTATRADETHRPGP